MDAELSSSGSFIERELLTASVDSIRLAQRLPRRPDYATLWRNGFNAKEGTIENSVSWTHNGTETGSPNVTLYEDFNRRYSAHVSLCPGKFLSGSNFDMPNGDELLTMLDEISELVSTLIEIPFDALMANVRLIDFATNIDRSPDAATKYLERSRRQYVPRMPYRKDLEYPTTVYLGNDSRIIRLYDKNEQMGLGNQPQTRIRAELGYRDPRALDSFLKKCGVIGRSPIVLLSKGVREKAIDELYGLMNMASFDPDADFTFSYFWNRTRSLSKARSLSSFCDSYKVLKADFWKLPEIRYSKARYIRELREANRFGF